MAEGRGRMADGGRRMADGRWRTADGRGRKADGRGRKAEGRTEILFPARGQPVGEIGLDIKPLDSHGARERGKWGSSSDRS
jgi:hypothetical protein